MAVKSVGLEGKFLNQELEKKVKSFKTLNIDLEI